MSTRPNQPNELRALALRLIFIGVNDPDLGGSSPGLRASVEVLLARLA